jgi:Peptidase family M28/PDZ domain
MNFSTHIFKRCIYALTLLLVLAPRLSIAQNISTESLKRDISFLASDSLQGRGTSTNGEKLAAAYIAARFSDLKLAPKGDSIGRSNSFLQRFPFIKLNPTLADSNRFGTNVVAMLDNGAARTIVIGAHFDHLGLGYDGYSLETASTSKGKIHNGADDNASGVAGVLELARLYATNGVKEPHNFLFICFSAEELGLLGSKYFTDHPTIPLQTVHCMVNLDMIGRFDDVKKGLVVGGVGTSPTFEPLVKRLAERDFPNQFVLALDSSGVGASDHTSFYLKKVPVLFFFTGVHKDYHRPEDDVERINFDGEAKVLRFVVRVVDSLQTLPNLAFTPTRLQGQTGHSYKVSLGVMPSYSYTGKGLKIDSVTENRPAARAGVQDGDVVVQIGSMEITDIYKYMEALSKIKAGETVRLQLLRDDKPVEVNVTF